MYIFTPARSNLNLSETFSRLLTLDRKDFCNRVKNDSIFSLKNIFHLLVIFFFFFVCKDEIKSLTVLEKMIFNKSLYNVSINFQFH